jgi:hypothetical protein
MARQETISNVPNSQVSRVKAEFEEVGATVVVTNNGDGTSTLVATFPDDASAARAHASTAQAHASAAQAHASAAQAHASAAQAHASAVQPSEAAAGAQGSKQAFGFFTDAGWTNEQSAGLIANIEAESNFNSQAVGDGGAAFGLCQWHSDRQRNFQQQFNKNIKDSSFTDQLRFVDFELRKGTEQRAGNLLLRATTAQDAGEIVCSQYERPKDPNGDVARDRGERAEELLTLLTQ